MQGNVFWQSTFFSADIYFEVLASGRHSQTMGQTRKFIEWKFKKNTWIVMDYRSKTKTTKQKKQPKSCPNPLFLKWLEQWRDEAKSKESKLQYVYSKVSILNSSFNFTWLFASILSSATLKMYSGVIDKLNSLYLVEYVTEGWMLFTSFFVNTTRLYNYANKFICDCEINWSKFRNCLLLYFWLIMIIWLLKL